MVETAEVLELQSEANPVTERIFPELKITGKAAPYMPMDFFIKDADTQDFSGLFRKDADGEPKQIGGAMLLRGQTRNEDGTEWCLIVDFVDQDDNRRQWLMPRSMLAGDQREILRKLYDRGYFVVRSSSAREGLAAYLNTNPPARFTTVHRAGWHDETFVTASENFGPGRYLLAGDHSTHSSAGTLNSWQTEVASRCVGNSRLLLSASTSFASPLLYLTGVESGGIHIVGNSSEGKTKAALVNRSVWGNELQRWRTTDNGLESTAATHSDIGLALDDIGQSPPHVIGECAYMLANGSGKKRATQDGSGRKTKSWRLLFISTGEVSLEDHMKDAGKPSKAGQQIRLVNVNANAGAGLGLFEDIHDSDSPQQFADTLETVTHENYGTAGPEFLRCIVKYGPKNCKKLIDAVNAKFTTDANISNDSGQVQRVATRFALIAAAGELATKLEVTRWPKGAAIEAAQACFRDWRKHWTPSGSHEGQKALNQVITFLQTQESRFEQFDHHYYDEATRVRDRAGYIRTIGDEVLYYIYPAIFNDEVCRNFRAASVKEALHHQGYIEKEGGKFSISRKPATSSRTQRFVSIRASIFDGQTDT